MGGGQVGGAEGVLYHTLEQKTAIVCTRRAAVYLSGQDGRWQQFRTKCSLISASQWHRVPHS